MQFIILSVLWFQEWLFWDFVERLCIFVTILIDVVSYVIYIKTIVHIMVFIVVWASLSIVKWISKARDYHMVYNLLVLVSWILILFHQEENGMLRRTKWTLSHTELTDSSWEPCASQSSFFSCQQLLHTMLCLQLCGSWYYLWKALSAEWLIWCTISQCFHW